jgi:hypothetical protein
VRALLAGLGLVGLCLYHAHLALNRPAGWARCLEAPAAHAGKRLVMPLYTVEAVAGPRSVVIGKVVTGIPVYLPAPLSLAPGDTISVAGTFDPTGPRVVVTEVELHPYRTVKEALGVVGLLIGLLLLPAGFVWRGDHLVERDLG